MIPFKSELEKEILDKLIEGKFSVVLPNIPAPKYYRNKEIKGPFYSNYRIEKRFGYYNGEWYYQITQYDGSDKLYTYYASGSDLEEFEAAIMLSKSEDELKKERKESEEKTKTDALQQMLEELAKQKNPYSRRTYKDFNWDKDTNTKWYLLNDYDRDLDNKF